MRFIIAAIASLTLIYGYFGVRVIRPAKLAVPWKIAFWLLLSLFFTAPPLAIVLRYEMPGNPAAVPVSWLAYLSFGFFTLAFVGLVLRDSLLLFLRATRGMAALVRRFVSPTGHAPPKNPSRRLFLVNSTNLAVLGATGSLTAYGLAEARQIPEVKHVEVPLANLPAEFQGFRILQITDLHVGMTIRRDYVQEVVARAIDQHPDLIVFTGDLADGRVNALRTETAPLAGLKADFGKFFVTGNHEYYAGVESWLAEARHLGFTTLLNEHRTIRIDGAGIVLAGVTDYRASRIVPSHASDPHKALAGAPVGAVKIMLAHQPKSVHRAEAAGADLLISGHTHGGQYIPFNYMITLDQPYVDGLHMHGRTQVYVSRGTGYWGPPVRIGAPSEITVLRLVRKPV